MSSDCRASPRTDQFAIAAGIREELLGGDSGCDPFNWDLRLELAWFDFGVQQGSAQARQEALAGGSG